MVKDTHTLHTYMPHIFTYVLHINTRKVKLFASFKIGNQKKKKTHTTIIPEEMERSPEAVWPWV